MSVESDTAIHDIRDWRGVRASRIIERLWQSGFPPFAELTQRGVGLIVLSACDAQPNDADIAHIKQRQPALSIITAPLDDIDDNEIELALIYQTAAGVAARVAQRHREGKNVLVTCAVGRNRSGLINALAVRELLNVSGKEAAEIVRRGRNADLPRGEEALSNPMFLQHVESLGVPR